MYLKFFVSEALVSALPISPNLFCSIIVFPNTFNDPIIIISVPMLQVQKTKEIISQISRVTSRGQHIHEVKDQLFRFINGVQNLNSAFSLKINRQMTRFQEYVIKISLYSSKSDHIINLSKLYRQFSLQIQRNSKVNLLNLQKIKQENIIKQEQKLNLKCERSIRQFQAYIQQQKEYNNKYSGYSRRCDELTGIINRYKSYQNPISFYNKMLINQYLQELERKNHQCYSSETEIITARQMIDEKRGFLTQNIKEVNEHYFVLIHNYLVIIENIIKCIVFPKNEEKLDKTELNLKNSDNIEEQHMLELQRLDNLYANTGESNKKEEDNPFEQFSDLYKKTVNQFEINSDYRFFHDRCDSMRGKKLKTSEESYKIQSHLVDQLKQQLQSYQNYEREYKMLEKDTFTNNGIQSYKKRFRKYFGSNFTEIFQLCLSLIERQKKSLDKISKNMEQNQSKMRKILQNKKESIDAFQRRSGVILQDHLKLKQKVITEGGSVDNEQLNQFKTSIATSYNELKKIFLQLQTSERADDRRFYSSMKSLYEAIMKEATLKNLNKLLQKQKNRINLLNNMNIQHEILLILKQDSRYENLLNQCPKPNLYSTFASEIKKKQIEQTKILLQKKDQRLKNMIRPKQGCCGIKSEVIKLNILSIHSCKLITEGEKYKGELNVSSNGLIFQQSTWNPFAEGMQLIIPQTDIVSFDTRNLNEKEMVQIGTDFGSLFFESDQNAQIIESMQKNITFKVAREPSEGGKRNGNDSSSFIKNNTSTEFKFSYERSQSDFSKVLKLDRSNVSGKDGRQKQHRPSGKGKSLENMLRELVKKWKQAQFFSEECFTKVMMKSEKRRDYQFHQGHSKFYLKQKREYKMIQKQLIFRYEWKISFPESPMLHSFKHHQQVKLENIAKDLRIRFVSAKYYEEQLYIKNKFYKEIQDMNKLLAQFIVYMLEKEAAVVQEQEQDQKKSGDSYNIVLDQINLEERDSRFQKTESVMRGSRIQKKSSLIPNKDKS